MSMINDALRRASSASKNVPVPPPPLPPSALPAAPVPPAAFAPPPPPVAAESESLPPSINAEEEPEAPKSSSSKVQIGLAMLLVLAVGVAAAVNFWEKRSSKIVVSAAEGRKAIIPDASSLRLAEKTLGAVTNRAAAAVAPIPAPAPVSAIAAPVAAALPPQPPPKFPALRLQSIFYRPNNPSVMINGKTLFVDDEIQGVTVADIQPASVTLVLSGHTNVLTLR